MKQRAQKRKKLAAAGIMHHATGSGNQAA